MNSTIGNQQLFFWESLKQFMRDTAVWYNNYMAFGLQALNNSQSMKFRIYIDANRLER